MNGDERGLDHQETLAVGRKTLRRKKISSREDSSKGIFGSTPVPAWSGIGSGLGLRRCHDAPGFRSVEEGDKNEMSLQSRRRAIEGQTLPLGLSGGGSSESESSPGSSLPTPFVQGIEDPGDDGGLGDESENAHL